MGGPFDSVGRRGIDLIGLGLSNDDLRAVQREVIELHVEAPTVAVHPGSADRVPEIALADFCYGVHAVAWTIG